MSDQSEKTKESLEVRGICAAIQAMSLPTFESLNRFLEKFGYVIKKKV